MFCRSTKSEFNHFTISHFQNNWLRWCKFKYGFAIGPKSRIWVVLESTGLITNSSSKVNENIQEFLFSVYLRIGNRTFIVIVHQFMVCSGVTEKDNETVRIYYERQYKNKRLVVMRPSILLRECHSSFLNGAFSPSLHCFVVHYISIVSGSENVGCSWSYCRH